MTEAIDRSTPHLEEFDPTIIPFQIQVIRDLKQFDYSLGVHEVLLSGSVGSAKSLLMAHLIIRHCLDNRNARVAICRRAMPQLRKTLWVKIKEHLRGSSLLENIHWKSNESRLEIKFCNGSEIISHTWADGHFDKVRSLELSMAAIEELTENDKNDFYKELRPRVGRIPHIKKPLILAATNPDSPSHWAYEYFIDTNSATRHVYYSLTEQNPFLPNWYIEQLKNDLDPKLAERLLYGRWVEINQDVVYYVYDKGKNFRKAEYKINPHLPIRIAWDFNIAVGKPLSAVLFQFNPDLDEYHFYDEVVVEGMRTENSCEELDSRGHLSNKYRYIIHGDATGKNANTRTVNSDYDIIKKYFANHPSKLQWELQIPAKNPRVKDRHNFMNALCENLNGKNRLFVYEKAKTADKAMRLTKLKKGAQYIEDDNDEFQHIGTAMGYGAWAANIWQQTKRQSTRAL